MDQSSSVAIPPSLGISPGNEKVLYFRIWSLALCFLQLDLTKQLLTFWLQYDVPFMLTTLYFYVWHWTTCIKRQLQLPIDFITSWCISRDSVFPLLWRRPCFSVVVTSKACLTTSPFQWTFAILKSAFLVWSLMTVAHICSISNISYFVGIFQWIFYSILLSPFAALTGEIWLIKFALFMDRPLCPTFASRLHRKQRSENSNLPWLTLDHRRI